MIVVGIDPDLRKSGVCVLKDGEIIELKSKSIVEVMQMISERPVFYSDCKFAIEDVNSLKPVFNRSTVQGVKLKIAQNVGQVKAVASIIVELIEAYTGEKVTMIPPGTGKQVKNNAELFNKLTGFEGKTNEDTRDAWAIATAAYKKLQVEQL